MFEFLRSLLDVRPDVGLLADRVMLAHTLVTWLCVLWALLIVQPWLSLAAAVMWLLTFLIWLEFKHGE